jgi:pimeloyl-ACP methyl ester carboxylesterase
LLKRHFDAGRPLFWLNAGGEDGRRAEHVTVEAIAAHYLHEVMTVAPGGPEVLGGFSFGAVVAFEMAQQLRLRGKNVRLLFLVDPTPPSGTVPAGDEKTRAVHADGGAAAGGSTAAWPMRHLRALWRLPARERRTYVSNRIIGWQRRIRRAIVYRIRKGICDGCLRLGRPVPLPLRVFYRNTLVFGRAMNSYAPRPYPGRMILFGSQIGKRVQSLPWERFAKENATTYVMPCAEHLEFLDESHFRDWCGRLEDELTAQEA